MGKKLKEVRKPTVEGEAQSFDVLSGDIGLYLAMSSWTIPGRVILDNFQIERQKPTIVDIHSSLRYMR